MDDIKDSIARSRAQWDEQELLERELEKERRLSEEKRQVERLVRDQLLKEAERLKQDLLRESQENVVQCARNLLESVKASSSASTGSHS